MVTNRQGKVEFVIPGYPASKICSPYIGICGLTEQEIIEKAKKALSVLGCNITDEYEASYIYRSREI